MVDLSIVFSKRLPEGKLWFSYGFPMVFLWFSYGFPMVFLMVFATTSPGISRTDHADVWRWHSPRNDPLAGRIFWVTLHVTFSSN